MSNKEREKGEGKEKLLTLYIFTVFVVVVVKMPWEYCSVYWRFKCESVGASGVAQVVKSSSLVSVKPQVQNPSAAGKKKRIKCESVQPLFLRICLC
jgi:hypothetical protein